MEKIDVSEVLSQAQHIILEEGATPLEKQNVTLAFQRYQEARYNLNDDKAMEFITDLKRILEKFAEARR